MNACGPGLVPLPTELAQSFLATRQSIHFIGDSLSFQMWGLLLALLHVSLPKEPPHLLACPDLSQLYASQPYGRLQCAHLSASRRLCYIKAGVADKFSIAHQTNRSLAQARAVAL